MNRLTAPQLRTLRALEQPWESGWWGGKPHGKWPDGINSRSLDRLLTRKLVKSEYVGAFGRRFSLTDAGRASLTSRTCNSAQPVDSSTTDASKTDQ